MFLHGWRTPKKRETFAEQRTISLGSDETYEYRSRALFAISRHEQRSKKRTSDRGVVSIRKTCPRIKTAPAPTITLLP